MTDLPPRPPLFSVHRMDDNGNEFVVRRHVSREEADRLVAEFEARGHKQTYWAREEPGPADPADPGPGSR